MKRRSTPPGSNPTRKPASNSAAAAPQPTRDGRLGRAPWLPLAIVALAVIVAYLNSFSAGYTLDNRAVLLNDDRVQAWSWANLRAIWTGDYWPHLVSGTYRPLTTLSYLLNSLVFTGEARLFGLHLVNLGLHLTNVALLFSLARRLIPNPWPAAIGAAWFGLHPVATEAVTNIVGRADLLAALTTLLGLSIHRGIRPGTPGAPWRRVALASVFAAGLFMKENAIALLPLIVLWDLLLARDTTQPFLQSCRALWNRQWKTYAALIPPLLAFFAARAVVYQELVRAPVLFIDNPLAGVDSWTARLTALRVLGDYVCQLIWPAALSCDYSFAQIPYQSGLLTGPGTPQTWLGIAALAAAVVFLIRGLRRPSLAVFGVGVFLATKMPTLNLILLIGAIRADRFLYLPSAGLALALAWWIHRWTSMPAPAGSEPRPARLQPVLWAIVAIALCALTARTAMRNADWRSDQTLWTSAARVSPGSYKVHASLAGLALGNEARPQDIDGCLREAEQARRIYEQAPPPVTNKPRVFMASLGNYYRIKGDSLAHRTTAGLKPSDESMPWYRKALAVLEEAREVDRLTHQRKLEEYRARGRNPDLLAPTGYQPLYLHLGDNYLRLSEYDKARDSYDYARQLSPAKADAYLRVAVLELARSRPEAAERALIQVVSTDLRQTAAWDRLRDLHLAAHPDCAAVKATHRDQPNLKADCPLFRTRVCEALQEFHRLCATANQTSSALSIRKLALEQLDCDPAGFSSPPSNAAAREDSSR